MNSISNNRSSEHKNKKIMKATDFSYKSENGMIEVISPYNKEFATKARNLRGKWDASKSAWIFDESVEDYLRKALLDCFGVTGEEPVEMCSLLINDLTTYADRSAVELFGRTIAKAYGRDSGAKLGDDIIWISGKHKSGGSVKNWRTEVIDATFEIQNFPVERTKFQDVQEAISEGWCEIKISKKKRSREEIAADIEACKIRLSELEKELESLE